MKDFESTSLRVRGGQLSLLDQTRLPHDEIWLECRSVADVIDHIRALRVRGAPQIANAAAAMLGCRAAAGDEAATLVRAAAALRDARPTAVNLMHAMDALTDTLQHAGHTAELIDQAVALIEADRACCDAIAAHGEPLIAPGDHVLTHCNTGSLATAGVGTAMGVIRRAHETGKQIRVWVDETRPLLQGGRLTAWECGKLGIPYRLIADNMAGSLMASGEVDVVIVGADRIAANGDFANKVGTYPLAVLAKYHDIPFFVAAPRTTVDPACASGADIPIEQRDADEIRGAVTRDGFRRWSPADAAVHNPAFDVTPADLVTGWILDSGAFRLGDIGQGALTAPDCGTASGG